MSSDKSSFTRIFYLYSLLPTCHAKPVTTTQLSVLMKESGYHVSRRTLERDLRKLSEIAGVDSERTADGNVWRHAGSKVTANALMAPPEALTMMVAEGMLSKVLPASSHRYLDNEIQKARHTLDSSNQFSRWQKKLHFSTGETSATALNHDQELNEKIYDAVLKELQIEVMYQGYGRSEANLYELNPLAIMVRDHYIYLVATVVGYPEELKLFSFYRMHSVECQYSDIEKIEKSRLQAFIDSDTTRGFIDSQVYPIELKVRRYSYEWLKFNQLNHKQELSESDVDGWYTVTFEDHVTYELAGWILKQSFDVKVESPPLLKDFIIERLESALAHY